MCLRSVSRSKCIYFLLTQTINHCAKLVEFLSSMLLALLNYWFEPRTAFCIHHYLLDSFPLISELLFCCCYLNSIFEIQMIQWVVVTYPYVSPFMCSDTQMIVADDKIAKFVTENLNSSYPVFYDSFSLWLWYDHVCEWDNFLVFLFVFFVGYLLCSLVYF